MDDALDNGVAEFRRGDRYKISEENRARAIQKGLVGADWYMSPVSKEQMRELLLRRNGPAIRDTIIWFFLLAVSGYAGFLLWGTWWAIIPFTIYGVLYASSSDSRWHESLHGTAFRSDWLNNALYEVASFMVLRQSTPWRWSHTIHHSDTTIVGVDPELAVPRPPDIKGLLLAFINGRHAREEFKKMLLHAGGKITSEEATYIPETAHKRVFLTARIYLLIYASVIALAVYTQSFLPLMYVGFVSFYGVWLQPYFGLTQHAAMDENVLDHRLNSRTIYMNPVFRYLYWEMNYHVEHHMFPMVPYHNLSKLHELIKDDCPTPYPSSIAAYREIIPAILRQVKDPTYCVKRELPTPSKQKAENSVTTVVSSKEADSEGWIEIAASDKLQKEDVLRYDHDGRTYAVYRTDDDKFYATDGICTHGNTHLATGLVKGKLIECPKHNGRFDIRDGSVKRNPVCVGLKTYPVREENGMLYMNIKTAGGAGVEDAKAAHSFRVVSNDNVATFIKELVLEPSNGSSDFTFTPGDYVQLEIPKHETDFLQIDVKEPYLDAWKQLGVFSYKAKNDGPKHRNYSMASNPQKDKQLRFNVRIATPPPGLACGAGVGSSYVFNLKPGDEVTALGPFGDFHLKQSEKEMIYVGGGAGMAPLRSHLSYLFETLKTSRKVSFWYGARSLQDVFYREYFEALEKQFDNFSFHLALSEAEESDQWTSHRGFIHEVLRDEYLNGHSDPQGVEYYLCGPPPMMKAAKGMLDDFAVSEEQIAYDEF